LIARQPTLAAKDVARMGTHFCVGMTERKTKGMTERKTEARAERKTEARAEADACFLGWGIVLTAASHSGSKL